MRKLLLLILGLIGCGPPRTSEADIESARRFVADNQGKFLARLDCPNAAMQPLGWRSLSEQERRNATLTLAIYCEAEHGRKAITVTDAQSGQPLSSYDGSVRLH
jgi:hypothetical protein